MKRLLIPYVHRYILAAFGTLTFVLCSGQAQAEVFPPPAAECAKLQAKYPQFKGKTARQRHQPAHAGL